jgi:hypothetical protein
METVTNANQEKTEASIAGIEVKIGTALVDEMRRMAVILDEEYSIKEANSILTQEFALKSEALKNSADLLKAAAEKVQKLQSIVTEQKGEIERLLARTGNSSEDNQVVTSSMKTVSTASQTSVNIPDYNINSSQPADAADKINRLEDQLYEKRKYVTKLKNKITRYRLQREKDKRAKDNTLSELEEKSNAQDQGTIKVGLNGAPILTDQIKTEAGFNNQEHPQSQAEQESVHSKLTLEVTSTETTCASSQLQSCDEKQTSKTTTKLPVPKDEKPKPVTSKDELCTEISRILDQLTRDSFSDSLSKLVALPLDSMNIAAVSYVVHEKVSNIPDSSQVHANLCAAIIRKLPTETSAKMKTKLSERCHKMFESSDVDSDSRVTVKKRRKAGKGENIMQKPRFEEALKQREKCVNSTRFMGELWSAGIIETDTIHKCICKMLNNDDDLSMDCFCVLVKAFGEELEESNINLSEYFSIIEDKCKSSNGLSSKAKRNLQDLIEFRRQEWIRETPHPKTDFTPRETERTHSEEFDLESASSTEADITRPSSDESPSLTGAGMQSPTSKKKKRRRRRQNHSVDYAG